MIFAAAAALAVVLAGGPQPQRWIRANRRSIAHISDPAQRRAREQTFAATLRELARERSKRPVLAANAGSAARRILSDGRLYRFGGTQEAPPKTWWEQGTEWLAARWRAIAAALFKHVRLSGSASLALGDLLLLLAIGAFLFLIARAVWQFARPSAQGAASAMEGAGPSAGELFARAERAAQSGRYTQSVTIIFAAALRELQARGELGDDPGETVGELRRRVRRKEFDVLARALTLALYADTSLAADDWERAREAYLTIVHQTEERHAA